MPNHSTNPVKVISNSQILISHFWSLNLHIFFSGLTFSGLGKSSIFCTFFDVTLLANVILSLKFKPFD